MAKNCKLLIDSYGSIMAPKLAQQAMAYHISQDLSNHAGVCLDKPKTDL